MQEFAIFVVGRVHLGITQSGNYVFDLSLLTAFPINRAQTNWKYNGYQTESD